MSVDPAKRGAQAEGWHAREEGSLWKRDVFIGRRLDTQAGNEISGVKLHKARKWADYQHELLEGGGRYVDPNQSRPRYQLQSADGDGLDTSLYQEAVLQDGRMTAPQVGGGRREDAFGVDPETYAARQQFRAALSAEDGMFGDSYRGGDEATLSAKTVIKLREQAEALSPGDRQALKQSLRRVGLATDSFVMTDSSPDQIAAGLAAIASTLPRQDRERLEKGMDADYLLASDHERKGFDILASLAVYTDEALSASRETRGTGPRPLVSSDARAQSASLGAVGTDPIIAIAQHSAKDPALRDGLINKGDKGGMVAQIQMALDAAGYNLGINGVDANFGKDTKNAAINAGKDLESLGVSNNIDSTGAISPEDMVKLVENLPRLQAKNAGQEI